MSRNRVLGVLLASVTLAAPAWAGTDPTSGAATAPTVPIKPVDLVEATSCDATVTAGCDAPDNASATAPVADGVGGKVVPPANDG